MMAMEQAQAMKEKGNACFAKHKYNAAVDFYTEAILLQSGVAAFYTNRALSYLHLEKWTKAQDDCHQAIKLDASNAKAFYLLGKSFTGAAEYTAGIEAFEKALELAGKAASSSSAPKASFATEALQGLRLAKKLKWQATHSSQRQRHTKITTRFHAIVEQSRTHQLKCAHLSDESRTTVHDDHDNVLAHMMELLESQQATSMSEVPEYFLCPIGMDIMYDPVTTPNGVSYERKWIEEHITRSHIDPLTRESLRTGQLRPNVGLRHAIEDFLNKHPWAYEQEY
ncbi:Aste57867_372 [Aphanomyces stellatus]|uniref:E3 ubiquitin-protein ligase CHIP n=1 Tax=Aphanomyces stellatus TaxID=120398 RepID=A0A485K5K1_9STRA|nr:hypothetical protein As57867_000371 [Aphanomyces stellatus]VFT77597.1 Aste57867_372 [Aphanomyces stellatus]